MNLCVLKEYQYLLKTTKKVGADEFSIAQSVKAKSSERKQFTPGSGVLVAVLRAVF